MRTDIETRFLFQR